MAKALLVDELRKVIAAVRREKGHVALCMLIAGDPETESAWNLMVSAVGYDDMTIKEALVHLINLTRTNLTEANIRSLTRYTVLNTRDPFVREMNRTFDASNGTVQLQNSTVSGIPIEKAILLVSESLPQLGSESRLEAKLRERAEQRVNWEQRKQEWVAALNALYASIAAWLRDYEAKDLVRLSRSSKSISEEHLGQYEVECLEIDMGDTTVVLEPVGTNIIGAYGRVDVFPRGYKDDAQLLLLLQHLEGPKHWELWKSKERGVRKELNKEVFEQLLAEWL